MEEKIKQTLSKSERMKKYFILLAVLMLGMSFNLDAFDQTIVSGQEKAIVSDDGSKIHLVRTTTIITVDTIKDYPVIERAQYYIQDKKVLNQLVSVGAVSLRDSLVPRRSHIFGVDTWIQRQLRINNGTITYETIAGYQKNGSLQSIFWICLIIFVAFCGSIFNGKEKPAIITLSIAFTFCFVLGFIESELTIFDLFLCIALLLIPAIVLIIEHLILILKSKKNDMSFLKN